VARELVKDCNVDLLMGDTVAHRLEVRDNHLRHRVHRLEQAVTCDRVRLTVLATNGDPHARVFEVRVYE
jgi:hypothetical protein